MSSAIHLGAVAGGAGGSWYVLMEGLARLVGQVHPDIRIDVAEGGGVSNHERVGSGEVAMGILNPPMTAAALAGRPPYDRAYPELRVGVANLTTNYLHCFVERALPPESVASWLEERQPVRMPVDRVGTVDRMVFQLTLDHFGVAEPDVERWGGTLVPARSYDEQLALYRAGAVNALWQFMGIPSPSIAAAHVVRPLRPLPFPPSLITGLEQLGWTPATLPSGAYGLIATPVPTVSMGTSLGFHAGVPDDVVYRIVRVVCGLAEGVRRIHAAASAFDPAHAHRLARGPLHTGATRYFRETGRITPDVGSA
jgi:TRAP transporter TAXI family solute receptor